MANFLEYVKKASHPLSLNDFKDVDAVVLCEIAYLKFGSYGNGHSFADLAGLPSELFPTTKAGSAKRDVASVVFPSIRFGKIGMSDYVHDTNPVIGKQFAAITYHIEPDVLFVAFRGTDTTIVGWKEDFNTAFLDEIPAQADAKTYLLGIATKYPSAKLIVGGHSKGGNLAVYASMKQSAPIRERIIKIYNLDGPGFKNEVFAQPDYLETQKKVTKIVPESSIVGMILEYGDNFRIIKSNALLLMQHDLTNWIINPETGDFDYLPELSQSSKNIKATLYDFLKKYGDEDRKIIVDKMFSMINDSHCKTIDDIARNWQIILIKGVSEFKHSDEKTQKLLKDSLFSMTKYFAINSIPGRDMAVEAIVKIGKWLKIGGNQKRPAADMSDTND